MSRSVGVVLPGYRPDTEVLGRYVWELSARLAPAEIRIELDDPRPATRRALADLPATVNAVSTRRGKGAAITAGFEALETDVLVFADADASTPVDSLAAVVETVSAGRADLAVGSRRHPDARVTSHQTVGRRYLGDGFAWLARRVLGERLYDYQCGAKALTAEAWAAARDHLYEAGFAWDIELVEVTGALGYRVREVPVVWEDQPGSTVSPVRTSLRLARGLLVSRHRGKRIRREGLYRFLPAGSRPTLADRVRAEIDE